MPMKTDEVPTASSIRVAADSCVNEGDLALWFNVSPETVQDWFRENPELRREFARRKLDDIRELRMLTRSKAMNGNLQALEKYVKMTFPGLLADKTNEVRITTEVRVLPPPDREPLIIEGALSEETN